ncbi:class I histocompatibility antigen, F10 alpha chain-like [Eublepharis macularius]|uniref:Class I histocompatibility antigen, F10 alpha chain-like n=1 Tax=Eublepharis macularius TaxID=481883 RepID=A0AA97J5U4_EUBMA|nr:class I histocompatibility antigen, F10 alpha chain-like [Eublepharis macularius]
MSRLGRGSLLLVAAAFLLGGCSGSSWHSLCYLCTMIGEPDQNVPDFFASGYVDDELVGHYNSTTRRAVPRVAWVRKVEKENPHFWDWNTHTGIYHELKMKALQDLDNHSKGSHIWQSMYCCELSTDGRKRGFSQVAYNGEDYISFDKENLTWTAAVVPAQVTKRKWDADLVYSKSLKSFLEEACIDWLQKGLDYGRESLLRREPPVVTVSRKVGSDGLETLVCRAHGFFPKEIDATWRKDGEIWEQETFRGGVVPNSDGTYYTWLSIKIHPEDRDFYRCHVEHNVLPEPLDLDWKVPVISVTSKMGLIVGVLVGVVAGLLAAGVTFYFWKRRSGYQAARKAPSVSDQLSSEVGSAQENL